MSNAEDKHYIAWKGWDVVPFGTVSKRDQIYFGKMLARAGRPALQGLDIVEIGYGSGGFLGHCRQNKGRGVGVEINGELVTMARAAGFEAVSVSDMADLPERGFDLAVAIDVIEHVQPEDCQAFFAGLDRLLKPGGVAILRFPNGDSPFSMPYQNGDFTHMHYIGSGKIRSLCTTFGYTPRYIGSDVRVFVAARPLNAVINAAVSVISRVVNGTIKALFYASVDSSFTARNLLVALEKGPGGG